MIRPLRPSTVSGVNPLPRSRARFRSFKKADVIRAIVAVKAGGIDVATVEIAPDGTIRLTAGVTDGSQGRANEFETWADRL